MENEDFKDEIKKINDVMSSKLGNPVLLGGYNKDEWSETIEYKVYEKDLFNHKLYFVTCDKNLPYILEFIETLKSGNIDKLSIIRKYAIEVGKMSESTIDRIISVYGELNIPSRIRQELDKIEKDFKPLIRQIKIDSLLNDDSDLT